MKEKIKKILLNIWGYFVMFGMWFGFLILVVHIPYVGKTLFGIYLIVSFALIAEKRGWLRDVDYLK